MSGKSTKKDCLNLQRTANSGIDTQKKRGRPPGSKNKPKELVVSVSNSFAQPAKKRGRPPGSKNKPSLPEALPSPSPAVAKKRGRPPGNKKKDTSVKPHKPEVAKVKPLTASAVEEHPLLVAAKWLEKKMHPSEMQHYRSRSMKNGLAVQHNIISDILGFFIVQDEEINKQYKKNNFIPTIKHGLHI